MTTQEFQSLQAMNLEMLLLLKATREFLTLKKITSSKIDQVIEKAERFRREWRDIRLPEEIA